MIGFNDLFYKIQSDAKVFGRRLCGVKRVKYMFELLLWDTAAVIRQFDHAAVVLAIDCDNDGRILPGDFLKAFQGVHNEIAENLRHNLLIAVGKDFGRFIILDDADGKGCL